MVNLCIFLFLAMFFWTTAPIFNSVMDVISFRWDKSLFAKYPKIFSPLWWNPVYSWPNKYIDCNPENPKKKWFWGLVDNPVTDAWHTFKSCMIWSIALSFLFLALCKEQFSIPIDLLIFPFLGLDWNMTFNLFYNKILIKK